MKQFFYVVFLLLIVFSNLHAQQALSIVPEPVTLKTGGGFFELDSKTQLLVDGNNPELKRLAGIFASWIAPATGFQLKVVSHPARSAKTIRLLLVQSLQDVKSEEGYTLVVTANAITLSASKPSGLFYGLQTLRQLLPSSAEQATKQNTRWTIPAVSITDYPRFPWRGLLLDVSRHFFS